MARPTSLNRLVLAALVVGLLAAILWSLAAAPLVLSAEAGVRHGGGPTGSVVALGYVLLFAFGLAFGIQIGYGLSAGSRLFVAAPLFAAVLLLGAYIAAHVAAAWSPFPAIASLP